MSFQLRDVGIVLCTLFFAVQAKASAPNCHEDPFNYVQDSLQKRGVHIAGQSVRARCDEGAPQHCSFEMTLTISSGTDGATDLPIAEWTRSFPAEWVWNANSDKGSQPLGDVLHLQPSPAAPLSLVARGPLAFATQSRGAECDGDFAPPFIFRHLIQFMNYRKGPYAATIPLLVSQPEVTVNGPDLSSATNAQSILIIAPKPESFFAHSGPFIANGVGFHGESRKDDYKLRVGYEFARPASVIYSLSAETDFRALVVAPVVELAPAMTSPAIGVGIPMRMFDRPAIGVRGQIAIHAPLIGVVFTIDAYPGLPANEQWVPSVYGQFSL